VSVLTFGFQLEFHRLLRLATQRRNARIMRALLEHGTNINLENGEPSSAVVEAIPDGMDEQVSIFLEYGADIYKVL